MILTPIRSLGACGLIATQAACVFGQPTAVGPAGPGQTVVTTGQLVHPAGETVEIPARPVDMVRSPDGKYLYIKEHKGVTVLDAAAWTVHQRLALGDDAASMTGIAISADGKTLYVTDATTGMRVLSVGEDGNVSAAGKIVIPPTGGGEGNSFPCGIALKRDGKSAVVCVSRNNTLGFVDLAEGKLAAEADVGVAPFAVILSPDEKVAYVSVWGGRRPREDEKTATSAGTNALVDARGIAASGGVSIVDLESRKEVGYVETGLSASVMALSRDGATLYVANSNNDTVSVVDTAARKVGRQIVVKPDMALPFGSMPSALALSADQKTLFVACAGNNAVAKVELHGDSATEPTIAGWIPTGWYPGMMLIDGEKLLIANIKGVGSRTSREDGTFNSRHHRGSIQRVSIPSASELEAMTAQVKRDARVPQVLREIEAGQKRAEAKAVPVPARPGEPSVIEHVIYLIKENRSYDQIFGDLAAGDKPRGNGRPDLCIYGREVTPNHHALAEQFVLLDNYYCNGVLSADGHSWATEGNSTPYLERSFGGFKRSYTYGDDPLTYSSSGFIWDHVLAAGFSFRNFGELAEGSVVAPEGKGKKWLDVYQDWKSGTHAYTFPESIGIEKLRGYSDLDAPGWDLDITDQIRADCFIAALKKFEAEGSMPAFIILHLPNDHTNGVSEGHPTPRAYVADNDLALGRIVEAVSHSKFWPTTCMFINEDDPQDGWDHVDGHRSLCLVVGPHVKRGQVVSEFYNQAGVVHTIERIFGLTAANQLYASAPVMIGCFADMVDLEPYTLRTPSVDIAEMNPPKGKSKKKPADDWNAPPSQKGTNGGTPTGMVSPSGELDLYALTAKQDFSKPDMVNDGELNLVLWHAAKGMDAPFPKEFAGAHGKGLAKLGLKLAPGGGPRKDDDDDD
jgi:YVTN family beta-propeller protein